MPRCTSRWKRAAFTCQSEGKNSDRQHWAKPAYKGGVGRAESPGGRGGSVRLGLHKQAVWNTRLRGQSGTKKWEPQCPTKVPTTFSPDGFQGLELPWHESPWDSVMPSGAAETRFVHPRSRAHMEFSAGPVTGLPNQKAGHPCQTVPMVGSRITDSENGRLRELRSH